MVAGLVYKVEDRSYLLPHYKRLLVEPFVRLVPPRVHPNAITHTGHLLNLSGAALLVALRPAAGWPFFAAALAVQLYNWCDNADGAHARRTGQCSALGELLDHGLDMFNTTYIAYMGAVGIGAPPLLWVAIALVLPAAAGVTYFEQAETGVFYLGRLNQVESVFALTAVLVVAGALGVDVFGQVHLGGVTLRLAVIAMVTGIAGIGILHGIWRVVRQAGARRALPVVPLLLFCAAIEGAAASGAIATVTAVAIAFAGNVYFGFQMLRLRSAGKKPSVDFGLLLAAGALAALAAWKTLGHALAPGIEIACAAAAVVGFGGVAALLARDGLRAVVALDRAAAARRTP